jgi:hypothetical protein
VAQDKFPIENPARFKSRLEGVVSGCTIPVHPGVRHEVIAGRSKKPRDGFVATLIPMSYLAPHQVVGDFRYFMRAGSDFSPVPHAVLAGMFGSRPQAQLTAEWQSGGFHYLPHATPETRNGRYSVTMILRNRGLGIARDIYVNVERTPPGTGSSIGVKFNDTYMVTQGAHTHSVSAMSGDSFRLGLQASVALLFLTFHLVRPIERRLEWVVSFGCSGAPINVIKSVVEPAEIESLLALDNIQASEVEAFKLLSPR